MSAWDGLAEFKKNWEATTAGDGTEMRPCFCVGPQNGDPVCPCMMRHVKLRNGRMILERDLGPAPSAAPKAPKTED